MRDQLEFSWMSSGEEAPPVPPPAAPSPPEEAQDSHRARYVAAEALAGELRQRTGMQLSISITDNSSTLLSVRHIVAGTSARLRLHHMFLEAPVEIRRALAHWVRHPKSKKYAHVLDGFIQSQRHKIRPKTRRRVTLVTKGLVYDLKELYAEVNAAHFSDRVNAWITWGRETGPRRLRSIRFGSYMPTDHIIRIHPLLDQEFVPRYFIRYIVFHEMLHAVMGVEESESGRRRIHPPEFKAIEAAYPEYARAVAWMNDPGNLKRLGKK